MKAPKIIAEIGCNHKGDMQIAKELIMTAATYCKADVVKFQKRCNTELLTPEEYNAPILILRIRMDLPTEHTVSSWSSTWTSIVNFRSGAMSLVSSTLLRSGM